MGRKRHLTQRIISRIERAETLLVIQYGDVGLVVVKFIE